MATQMQLLDAVKTQPDLIDFLDYLVPLLNKIERLQNYILLSSVRDKTKLNTLDASFKLDTVLNKDLPEMVNNFCSLDFDWRNTAKINSRSKNLTPKELLLENLSAINHSVEEIETSLNIKNVNSLLAQNAFLASQVSSPISTLEQKFNYSKEPLAQNLPAVNVGAINDSSEDESYFNDLNAEEGLSAFEIVLSILSVFLVIGFFYFFINMMMADNLAHKNLKTQLTEISALPYYASSYLATNGSAVIAKPAIGFAQLIGVGKNNSFINKESVLANRDFAIKFPSMTSYTINYKLNSFTECFQVIKTLSPQSNTIALSPSDGVIPKSALKSYEVQTNGYLNTSLFNETCSLTSDFPVYIEASGNIGP